MITQTSDDTISDIADQPAELLLVRYGSVPQVARFEWPSMANNTRCGEMRGTQVVVETDRGEELGEVLEVLTQALAGGKEASGPVLRTAVADDIRRHQDNQQKANDEFGAWQQRIADWKLEVQLIDLEWTLDRNRVVLYVLNDRGAETTRLALLAAAAGLGVIHVQPVGGEGVIHEAAGGGCGTGGCGSGGCG